MLSNYKSADWDEVRTFYLSFPCEPVYSSFDDACAAAVADAVMQSIELYIPTTVVPIGGKSQP